MLSSPISFNPARLNYSSEGCPILSRDQIEAVASEVLGKYAPNALTKPSKTPVLALLDGVATNTELKYAFAALPENSKRKVLGLVNFRTRQLLIDESLRPNPEPPSRFAFTLAHEIGHWILHRYAHKHFWSANSESSDELDDDEETLFRLEERTLNDWLEWQANTFAAQLLMPKETFHYALQAAQISAEIKRNIGEVWLCDEAWSRRDFKLVTAALADFYGTSASAVTVRLRTLKLLRENSSKPVRAWLTELGLS